MNKYVSRQEALEKVKVLTQQLKEATAKLKTVQTDIDTSKPLVKLVDDELYNFISTLCSQWNCNLDYFVSFQLARLMNARQFKRPPFHADT